MFSIKNISVKTGELFIYSVFSKPLCQGLQRRRNDMASFGGGDFNQLSQLSELLAEPEADLSKGYSGSEPSSSVLKQTVGQVDDEKAKKDAPVDPDDIWTVDEVPAEETAGVIDDNAIRDSRPEPKFELMYKQGVGTEDLFLGTEKTPGSMDCTHLVYRITFPGHKMADLELDVTKNSLKAESKTLRLAIFLPLSVDFDNGSAKWDAKSEALVITLPINPEDW